MRFKILDNIYKNKSGCIIVMIQNQVSHNFFYSVLKYSAHSVQRSYNHISGGRKMAQVTCVAETRTSDMFI